MPTFTMAWHTVAANSLFPVPASPTGLIDCQLLFAIVEGALEP